MTDLRKKPQKSRWKSILLGQGSTVASKKFFLKMALSVAN